MPLIFFPRVVPPRAGGPRHLDGLAVDAAGAGLGLLAGLLTDLTTQVVVDPFPQPAPTPAMEVVAHRPFGGEIMGQRVPSTPVGQEIEDGVEDLAEVGRSRRPRLDRGRQQGLQESPLLVGEVGGVGLTGCGGHAAGSEFLE